MKAMKRTKSLVAIAAGMCLASVVMAQSTTGNVQGSAKPGTQVVISSNSGLTRTVTADASGRFSANQLPVGDYTIKGDGATRNVTVTVGATASVALDNSLETVTVTGVRAKIDTTTTESRTVFTAKELSRLPLTQNAQSIALLSPGANAGSGQYFGNLTSFGGAGVSENAYYINGFFAGEPLSNLGQMEMPYGAIAQQETYTGGYSAKYGRSDGGVISQVGKSGTNEFVFGGQISITPKSMRSDARDIYYPKLDLPAGYEYANGTQPGTLYRRASGDTNQIEKYSLYAGGPIIQDKLFAFVALEAYKRKYVTTPAAGVAYSTDAEVTDPKAYLKLNWNITNDHLLEYTHLREKYKYSGKRYAYDFATGNGGALQPTVPTPEKRNSDYNILSYTGYLSDSLTLSATLGRGNYTNTQINPTILPGVPFVSTPTNQNPALNGGTPIPNRQGGYQGRDGRDISTGLRADVEWKINNAHTLSFGIDNIKFEAENEGTSQVAPYFQYARIAGCGNISGGLGVGSPCSETNPDGYYVRELKYFNNTTMSLDQKAWYVEDRWNLTKNFLLSLGLRNDRFTNKNDTGTAYMDAKNQWAPRIAATWDVMGDQSLKAFANAGRYFLALPNNVAIRGASASTFTYQYSTYTGIDANGLPTGLTPVNSPSGTPSGPVSSNLEVGKPVDVESFAPKDMKNMYQDEFILGFEKALTKGWTVGAKFTHRALKSAVDDMCDSDAVGAAAGLEFMSVDYDAGKYVYQNANGKQYYLSACYMFNPGGSNTYSFEPVGGGERLSKKISSAELGYQEGVKRTYNSVDLFLERAFDNVWSLRIDYTYSKLKGNTEGQVKSEFGQDNISKTQDWDAWQIMAFANGYLFNDRRHQLKIRGAYQFTKEWLVMGNARVLSGSPSNCLGYYNPGNIDEESDAADPIHYGSSYHTCFGKVATPGDVRTPWTHNVDLGLQYRPAFANGKLSFTANVFNVLNQRKIRQVDVTSETGPYTVSNTYGMQTSATAPRYWQFSVSYDY
jgi:hypothetical protein